MRCIHIFCSLLTVLCFASFAFCAPQYPEEIAKEVPLYPGASVMHVMQMQGILQVVIQPQGAMDDVVTFYKDAAKKSGWTSVLETTVPDGNSLHYSKGDSGLTITVGQDEELVVLIVLAHQN
ncbi:hypothetical protein [Desulfovibrio inopinatus]|uniref:hypothetical protein n=1 Tax=Desulfovibrio inopinatus TaxID=102109 RepID=UPI0004058FA0|nr:hypothetical protein [Desulfovibrio inopinatus]